MKWLNNCDFPKCVKNSVNTDKKVIEHEFVTPKDGWNDGIIIVIPKPPTMKEKRMLKTRSEIKNFHFDVV